MESSLTTPDQNPGFGEEGPSRYGAPRQSRYVAALLSLGVCGLLLLTLLSMAAVSYENHTAAAVLTALNLVPPPEEKKPKPHNSAKAPKPAQHTPPAATYRELRGAP